MGVKGVTCLAALLVIMGPLTIYCDTEVDEYSVALLEAISRVYIKMNDMVSEIDNIAPASSIEIKEACPFILKEFTPELSDVPDQQSQPSLSTKKGFGSDVIDEISKAAIKITVGISKAIAWIVPIGKEVSKDAVEVAGTNSIVELLTTIIKNHSIIGPEIEDAKNIDDSITKPSYAYLNKIHIYNTYLENFVVHAEVGSKKQKFLQIEILKTSLLKSATDLGAICEG